MAMALTELTEVHLGLGHGGELIDRTRLRGSHHTGRFEANAWRAGPGPQSGQEQRAGSASPSVRTVSLGTGAGAWESAPSRQWKYFPTPGLEASGHDALLPPPGFSPKQRQLHSEAATPWLTSSRTAGLVTPRPGA